MDRDQLIDLLVNKSIGYLEYDDANPNVGMGMWISDAVSLAEKDVLQEAQRWNSQAALLLNFDSVRKTVVEKVRAKRS